MRTLSRILTITLVAVAPAVALAQVAPPGDTPPTPPPTDDAKIRELVDREVARVLGERAAAEAAKQATKEAEPPPPPDAPATDLTGANGFFDTRLAFTLTNENVLVKPGDTIPSVPGWRFGTPNSLGVLFFDNYDTRYSGFETLSHATMYRDYERGHFEAEAALVVRINELSGSNINLSDDGTYIKLTNWKDPTHKDPTRLSLTAFPVSADRFRLGYSYRLSWGGDPEYQRTNSATPGAKLQYDTEKMYVFVGAKSAIVLDERTAEQKSALAGLFGAGYDPTPMIRLELNGGYFDRGYNELQDVNDQKVQLYGLSGQISVHQGMPLRSSLDYRLYKNNNENISGLFNPETYPGGVAWLAQSEYTILAQTLKDPNMIGSTTIQMAHAGDINVRVKIDRIRLRLDLSYRDLAFILHSQPSLPTYEDFPSDYKTSPDFFGAVGVDRNWNDWITAGLVFGVERPASLTSPKGIPGGGTDSNSPSTAVIRNNNVDTVITILPPGQSVVPQIAFKANLKLDFGRIFSALLEVFYSNDGNTTQYVRTCSDVTTCPFGYVFANENQLGINATLQARF